ncbi:MAG: hypothetical protein ACRYFE_09115 [Janthinobacterium lividum]|nr:MULTISPECIES: hypothetical protein [unclassified Brevundimonas]
MSLKTETPPRDLYAAMLAELERLAELQRELVRQAHAVAEAA